ncbi:MAG: DUF1566 domain-containing protein [Myxococcota bacterium]
MQIGIPTPPARTWILLAGMLVLPGRARAGWGDEVWGVLVWGEAVSGPQVPGLGLVGLTLLAVGLAATAAWTLRRSRPAIGLTLMLVLLSIPLVVAAGTLTVPNSFTNGQAADAGQVNANFDAIETEVNDNDGRITTVEGTANAAQVRVTGSCVAGSSIRAIAADGTVTCEVDDNSDNDTTYTAGSGLSLAGTSFSADTAVVQSRVVNTCVVGQAISAIAADGTVTCALLDPPPDTGFEACADGLTVADHDHGLLWEMKTGTVGTPIGCELAGCSDPHDVNNTYEWSNSATAADGGAFTDFVAKLNDPVFGSAPDVSAVTGCFAAHCDWRVPTITELMGIRVGTAEFPPTIDPAFGVVASSLYWSASTVTGNLNSAWSANFSGGFFVSAGKGSELAVRAVRAGSCTN